MRQDFNVLYQIYVFHADPKNKMAARTHTKLRHFRLLLNGWTEFAETWQEGRSQQPLQRLFFRADQKSEMAFLVSDWLRDFDFSSETAEQNSIKLDRMSSITFVCVFFCAPEPKSQVHYCDHALLVVRPSIRRYLSHFRLLLWNHEMEFNETWQEARSQRPLSSLCFSGRLKNKMAIRLLAETFSTSSLKPLNRAQWNFTKIKISTSSTKFVFFGPIGIARWPPWPLIDWDIFDFFSEIAERNSTKLDRKQDLNVFYLVCVFRTDRKNKMPAPFYDWLRHFRLLLWNRWLEFNETWRGSKISTSHKMKNTVKLA